MKLPGGNWRRAALMVGQGEADLYEFGLLDVMPN